MGRKSKSKAKAVQPFCYYCDREFDDENVLIQHQKVRASHARCCTRCCGRRAFAAGAACHSAAVKTAWISSLFVSLTHPRRRTPLAGATLQVLRVQ